MNFGAILNDLINEGIRVDFIGANFLIVPFFLGIAVDSEGKVDLSVGVKDRKVKTKHVGLFELNGGVTGSAENGDWDSCLVEFLDA